MIWGYHFFGNIHQVIIQLNFCGPGTWIPISWNRRLMQCAAARSPSSLPRAPCRPLMTICFFRCPGSSRSVGSVTWRILLLRKSFLSNKLDPDQLDIQDLVLGECWGYVPDHGYIYAQASTPDKTHMEPQHDNFQKESGNSSSISLLHMGPVLVGILHSRN